MEKMSEAKRSPSTRFDFIFKIVLLGDAVGVSGFTFDDTL
jgi:hypothetical protein